MPSKGDDGQGLTAKLTAEDCVALSKGPLLRSLAEGRWEFWFKPRADRRVRVVDVTDQVERAIAARAEGQAGLVKRCDRLQADLDEERRLRAQDQVRADTQVQENLAR